MELQAIQTLLRDLAALIWPTACVACGVPDRDCCEACAAEVRDGSASRRLSVDGLPCFVRGRYDGPLRAVLVAFKHQGRYGFRRMLEAALRAPLLDALAAAAPAVTECSPLLVVGMPSRPRSVRRRGYRHLEVLVLPILRRGAPSVRLVRALRTTRGRRGQVGLSSLERERNAHRIAVPRRYRRLVRRSRIVLVDDIITTGASLRAARLALEAAGGKVVAMSALCMAERRDSKPKIANLEASF